MKKNLILSAFLVGIFVVSLVSAGWFGDFFERLTSTGNVVSIKGIRVDKDVLSSGIELSRGSNYYFIWNGEDAPISEIVDSLKENVRHVREMPSSKNGKRNQYWYGEGNSQNTVDSFKKGEKYLIYMNSGAVWKIECASEFHSADYNNDGKIDVVELSRVVALMSTDGEYHCKKSTVDGYSAGSGDRGCTPHDVDVNKDWIISKEELNKVRFLYECRIGSVRTGEYTKKGDSFYQADRCNKEYSCSSGQKIGDVNGDGNIDEYDVELLMRSIYGEINFSNICCLDVNQDGKATVFDALEILHIFGNDKNSPGICGEGDTPIISGGSGGGHSGTNHSTSTSVTYQGILDMFKNNCEWWNIPSSESEPSKVITCEEVCSSVGKSCVFGQWQHTKDQITQYASGVSDISSSSNQQHIGCFANSRIEISNKDYPYPPQGVDRINEIEKFELQCFCCQTPN